jgi:hypothetical protein
MTAGRTIYPPKKLAETVQLAPNFISALQASETIATAVCTASVFSGTDPNPAAIISGAAAINGTIVTQLVTGGVLGCVYEFLCTVTTSLGQTLGMSGFLAIAPDLP